LELTEWNVVPLVEPALRVDQGKHVPVAGRDLAG